MTSNRWIMRAAIAVLCLPLLAAAPASLPKTFSTPEAAVETLVAALQANDQSALAAIFGASGAKVLYSGDTVADANAQERFLAAYTARHAIAAAAGRATLSIGTDDWPFPIPLKQAGQGWTFDVAAGEEEILDRRIGANELFVQQVMLAYVDAQVEYAASLHDGAKIRVYARRLLSTPGKQDGLFWETKEAEPPSPLGALVAGARVDGYSKVSKAKPEPYHGYHFKILTAQGSHAPGGAFNYIQYGQMFGGFALVAWPAQWGNSGVMTFIVSHNGKVYQKNLGANTAKIATGMTRYDPDPTWKPVEVK